MGEPIRPEDPHSWEPPDSRNCAICGVDYDDHPEPDLDIGPLPQQQGQTKRYRLVPIEEDETDG